MLVPQSVAALEHRERRSNDEEVLEGSDLAGGSPARKIRWKPTEAARRLRRAWRDSASQQASWRGAVRSSFVRPDAATPGQGPPRRNRLRSRCENQPRARPAADVLPLARPAPVRYQASPGLRG